MALVMIQYLSYSVTLAVSSQRYKKEQATISYFFINIESLPYDKYCPEFDLPI